MTSSSDNLEAEVLGRLEELLALAGGAEEIGRLGEIAADQCHLDGEDLARILTDDHGALSDAERERLTAARRHALHCERCGRTVIERAIAHEQAELERQAQRSGSLPAKRGPQWAMMGIILCLSLTLLVVGWPASDAAPTAVAEEGPKRAPLELSWIGFGGAEDHPEGRSDVLYARVHVDAQIGQAHLYLFLVGEEEVAILHPLPQQGTSNPIEDGITPNDGWVFPAGAWVGVVGLMAPALHPMLASHSDRQQVAAELSRMRKDGASPVDLAKLLGELPGSSLSRIVMAPLPDRP